MGFLFYEIDKSFCFAFGCVMWQNKILNCKIKPWVLFCSEVWEETSMIKPGESWLGGSNYIYH